MQPISFAYEEVNINFDFNSLHVLIIGTDSMWNGMAGFFYKMSHRRLQLCQKSGR